jgi:hypothetical protein
VYNRVDNIIFVHLFIYLFIYLATCALFYLLSFLKEEKSAYEIRMLCAYGPLSPFEQIDQFSRNFGMKFMPLEATPGSYILISFS